MKKNVLEKFLEQEEIKKKYEKDVKELADLYNQEWAKASAEIMGRYQMEGEKFREKERKEKREKEREDRRRFNELGPKEYLIEKVLKVYPNLDRETLEKKSYNEIQEDLFNGVYLLDSDSTNLESLLG